MSGAPLPAAAALLAVLAATAAALCVAYLRRRTRVPARTYDPALAWLRAGLYFCACLALATLSGALGRLLSAPLADAAHLTQAVWWSATSLYAAVIVVAYGVVWPIGTFTDGRRRHVLLSLAYGALWGLCQGLLFLSIWIAVAASGLPAWAVAVICYLLIGGYNGVWHRFFWDIHVSPPHNYTEWNGRKVLLCHTPNLLLGLTHLAVYGDAAVFVLAQVVALALSAQAMRFPAFWDDYRAEPGQERPLAARAGAAA